MPGTGIKTLPRVVLVVVELRRFPRIHNVDFQIREVFRVSRSKLRAAGEYDPGSLRIPNVNPPAPALSFSRQQGGGFGCRPVKIQYSSV